MTGSGVDREGGSYEVKSVILAALLHDIGKLMQRAKEPFNSPKTKNEEPNLCLNGSHRHALWTYDFFETYIVGEDFLNMGINPEMAKELASHHHRPLVPHQELITKADRLSAGMDRQPRPDDDPKFKDAYLKERLRPIFPQVDLGLKDKSDYVTRVREKRYSLRPLILEKEVIFPKSFPEELLSPYYRSLFDDFVAAFNKLPKISYTRFLNHLLHLLYRFTWAIPSSTVDLPDISLFDHLKTTAAIASCRYIWEMMKSREDRPYYLLIGDISGIQKYLYRITQAVGVKGVSRRLRGRSLYLSLLPEVMARYILRELDLYTTNLLHSSGGNFYLLLPNTPKVVKELSCIISSINEWMLKEFYGELSLVLHGVPCSDEDIRCFGKTLANALDGVNAKKYQKFSDLMKKEDFFVAEEVLGKELTVCPSCNMGVITKEEEICRQCSLQTQMGKFLPKLAKCIGFANSPIRLMDEEKDKVLEVKFDENGLFGIVYLLPGVEGNEAIHTRFESSKEIEEIAGINETTDNYGLKFMSKTIPVALEDFEIETEEDRKAEKDSALTFGTIGSMSAGDSRIGILKMDVDRLGLIFSQGLLAANEDKRSISRIAAISRQLDLFFGGYLNKICEECFKKWREKTDFGYKDKISNIFYITYSGGDDLLIIGPWSEIPHIAQEIRNEFHNYVCENPELTISAGVFITKPAFPINRAAVIAGEELDLKAKDKGRNRICIFGESTPWLSRNEEETDFEDLIALGEQLFKGIEEKKIPRGLVHNLLTWRRQFLEGRELNPHYIPTLIYQIYRNIKPDAELDGENLQALLKGWFITEKRGKERFKEVVIPASYALLKTRRR